MNIPVKHTEDNGNTVPVRKLTSAEAGRLGGLAKVKKGFATDIERAKRAGSLGGKKRMEKLRGQQ